MKMHALLGFRLRQRVVVRGYSVAHEPTRLFPGSPSLPAASRRTAETSPALGMLPSACPGHTTLLQVQFADALHFPHGQRVGMRTMVRRDNALGLAPSRCDLLYGTTPSEPCSPSPRPRSPIIAWNGQRPVFFVNSRPALPLSSLASLTQSPLIATLAMHPSCPYRRRGPGALARTNRLASARAGHTAHAPVTSLVQSAFLRLLVWGLSQRTSYRRQQHRRYWAAALTTFRTNEVLNWLRIFPISLIDCNI